MRTRFVCSIHNEAIIKALFKIKDDELTFTRAIEIAAEVEEATRTASHGNADALSRLPAGADPFFDREETGADSTTICTIKMTSNQIVPTNPKALESATSKDKTLTGVIQCL
ncbi:transposon tf2-6 polyprotein [Plakobranchus ocellatus]|uniref:Transposon tf2-6 polyprotein n=1 Tax=Plakobranchus ocellatus TaxID=259542 RepID=A0AAV3YJA1_9GAST|nr:transposon tf2-6 polyprotein [Plakobranchus ocellatus]